MLVSIRGKKLTLSAGVPSQAEALEYLKKHMECFDGPVVFSIHNSPDAKPLRRVKMNVGYLDRVTGIRYSTDPDKKGGLQVKPKTLNDQYIRCRMRSPAEFTELIQSFTTDPRDLMDLQTYGDFAFFPTGVTIGFVRSSGKLWIKERDAVTMTYALFFAEAVRSVLTGTY